MNGNDKVIKPAIEWMESNYDKLNQDFFGGVLGDCDFDVQPIGIHTLGRFRLRRGTKVSSYDRRIFVEDMMGRRTYINYGNFASLCRPIIILNSGYSATEEALLNTLLHEMCHYYCYCFGIAPTQGHGTEFRNIAHTIDVRSGGKFNITRLTGAEEMKNYEADDALKAKRERLKQNKLRNIKAYIWTMDEEYNDIRLTTTSSPIVANTLIAYAREKHAKELFVVDDIEFNKLLMSKGYFDNVRKVSWWRMKGVPWFEDIKSIKNQYNTRTLVYNGEGMCNEKVNINEFVNVITEAVLNRLRQTYLRN